MTTSFNQILLAFWRQSNTDTNRWFRPVFYGVVLIGLAVAGLLMPTTQLRLLIACTVTVIALFGLWVMLVVNLLEQNHPTTTRLVPGHLRRLRQATLAVWLLISVTQGVLAWLALSDKVSLPTLLLAASASGVAAAWAQRHWMCGIVFYMGPSFVIPLHLNERLAPLWQPLVSAWLAQPWTCLALCVVVFAALLVRIYGTGDNAHQKAYEQRQRKLTLLRRGLAGSRTTRGATQGGIGDGLARPVDAIAARWLARLLAQARPQQANVMARAELALHGPQHWLRHAVGLGTALPIAVFGIALFFQLIGAAPDAILRHSTAGMALMLAVLGFSPGFTLPSALWLTRREQALLVLLPGMPQGRQLNHAVAFMQLRHFLIAWGITTLLLGGLLLHTGNTALLSLSVAALPLGVLNLTRAPATLRAPTPWTSSRPVLSFFLLNAVLWGLCAWLDGLVWWLGAVSLVLSAALLAWRWRALGQAPSALPAGRAA